MTGAQKLQPALQQERSVIAVLLCQPRTRTSTRAANFSSNGRTVVDSIQFLLQYRYSSPPPPHSTLSTPQAYTRMRRHNTTHEQHRTSTKVSLRAHTAQPGSLNHSYMPTHTTRTAQSHSNTKRALIVHNKAAASRKNADRKKEDKNHSPLVAIITRRPCRPSQASRRGVSSDPPPTSSSRNRAAGHSDRRRMAARAGWRPPRLLEGRRPSSRRR